MNAVVLMSAKPAAFDRELLADMMWTSGLFGRATHSLVLARQLERAVAELDAELESVAGMQRALLPQAFPHYSGVDIAVHYETSRRAGGDYYEIFPLSDHELGLFIGDASGHGTPAAVTMAIAHAIGYSYPGAPQPPDAMLSFINQRLSRRYTGAFGAFVTAFYGIYDLGDGTLTYASAGHNPPRLHRTAHGVIEPLEGTRGIPLGIDANETYNQCAVTLEPGDRLFLYTDGITEAMDAQHRLFEVSGLDTAILGANGAARDSLKHIIAQMQAFTGPRPPQDDQTLMAMFLGGAESAGARA